MKLVVVHVAHLNLALSSAHSDEALLARMTGLADVILVEGDDAHGGRELHRRNRRRQGR